MGIPSSDFLYLRLNGFAELNVGSARTCLCFVFVCRSFALSTLMCLFYFSAFPSHLSARFYFCWSAVTGYRTYTYCLLICMLCLFMLVDVYHSITKKVTFLH